MNHLEAMSGCLYGVAVGDALGVPYEFRRRDAFRLDGYRGYGTHNRPPGTWSDDTALTLATLHSLIANDGRVDTDDMRTRFVSWLDDGLYTPDGIVFDCGLTTAKALRTGRGANGLGNGSLMRIAPLAFTDADDDTVGAVSAITHANRECRDRCALQVRLLRRLLDGETMPRALGHEGMGEVGRRRRDRIESDGLIAHTQTAALWCAANSTSWLECVTMAVELGGDTDTTACVAGAMAGIAYGPESIPADLRDGLRGHTLLDVMLGACTESPS